MTSWDIAALAVPSANKQDAFDWTSLSSGSLGEFLVRSGSALAILVIGWWLARWASRLLDRALARVHVDTILRNFLRNVSFAILMVVVFIAALQKFGVPTTSLLAVVGAAGLAIGLALKDSLSNIASGVMLIMLRPFRAGDVVRVAGLEGTVEQVRIFTTRLRTAQNESIVMPNSQITNNPIINLTGNGQRRVDVKVSVAYGTRIDQCRQVLLDMAHAHPDVLAQPAPGIGVENLSAGGIDLVLHAWASSTDHGHVRSDLTEGVERSLTQAGIEIAAPPREYRLVMDEGKAPGDASPQPR